MARSTLLAVVSNSAGNAGIELLGDAPHDVRLGKRHAHGLAQVMVALDVRGDANGQKEIGHLFVDILPGAFRSVGNSAIDAFSNEEATSRDAADRRTSKGLTM